MNFSPTYPGELDKTKNEYTLSYPGVSFVFPIPEEHISLFISSTDLPLELPDGTSPLLSRLHTYHGANFRNVTAPPLPRNVNPENMGCNGDLGEVESVVAELKRGITVNFLARNNSNQISVEILLNVTTPQDLIVDIGSPLRIFYKEEDKMRIHSKDIGIDSAEDGDTTSNKTLSNGVENHIQEGDMGHPIDYFYNYFHLGFDVLFDGVSHRCKKIILHVAKLEVFGEDDDDIHSTSASTQNGTNYISSEMKLIGPPSGRPLIFNRGAGGQNPFGPTELSGYDDSFVRFKIFTK
ncbi:19863_t:CDS:2 [Racocetra fulgida]|uniref:19863_t:CDS:1 n=1 Tax=Racocetra fulgida TaxID=60492 RepID=A0A9N8VVN3_9GLOM|nr:19863_t:CDS:2 [Racocetra fulgida]